jgi:hypothetical protein
MRMIGFVVAAAVVMPRAAAAEEHVVDLAYDASLASSVGDARLVDAAVGGEAADTISFAGYEVEISAAADVHHLEGAVRATGAATRAALAVGPAPLALGDGELARTVWSPLSFELGHEGDLAALPRLSARLDVRRAPYRWQRFTAATRAVRVQVQRREDDELHAEVDDIVPIDVALDLTEQDGAQRIDATASVGLAAFELQSPFLLRAELPLLESKVSRVRGGPAISTLTAWLFRVSAPVPTGLTYSFSWGYVLDVDDQGVRERVIDHHQLRQVGSAGLGYGTDELGGGLQILRREAYLALDGRAMLEDTAWLELWFHAGDIRWYGKAFLARTRRIEGAWQDWTGGVELDASRDVGLVNVGVAGEAGQSFYGPLDGAAPSPGFAARGSLTVRRAAGRRWAF